MLLQMHSLPILFHWEEALNLTSMFIRLASCLLLMQYYLILALSSCCK